MATLELEDLTRSYGKQKVIHGLSLSASQGEFLTLLGSSGCGKSTTLRIIAGFEAPDGGRVRIGDRLVSSGRQGIVVSPEQRNVGLVFQSYALWPHMTIGNNVSYGLRARKCPSGEIRSRVIEALRLVRMDPYIDRYPSELSGGQQQRVALARAVVYRPGLLLLDEPLSNLDAKLREHMRIEIRELQQRLGLTVVYVTHDQAEAMSMSDRVALLHEGRILQVGPPEDLYRNPQTPFVADFIGRSNIIEGKAETAADAGALVDLEIGGVRIAARATTQLVKGQAVALCMRAESITLAGATRPDTGGDAGSNLATEEGRQWRDGVVVSTSFFGDNREVIVDALGSRLQIRAAPVDRFTHGQPVRIGVAPGDCMAIGKEKAA